MAALMALGAYLHIPLGPVPIVLSTLFVLFSGLVLGSRWGMASVGLYLLVGAIGMPVFAGGRGGVAHLFGPTGGYLAGFLLAAGVTGFVSERSRGRILREVTAVVLGSVVIYALGLPWLKGVTQMPWSKAVWVGMVPFLPGDALKAFGALMLARTIRPILGRSPDGKQADLITSPKGRAHDRNP